MELQVEKDLTDQTEHQAQSEPVDLQDWMDSQVSMELMERPEMQERTEVQEHKDTLVRLADQEPKDDKVFEEAVVSEVLQEMLEVLDQLDHQVSQDQWDPLVTEVHQEM